MAMSDRERAKRNSGPTSPVDDASPENSADAASSLDPDLICRMREIAAAGLNPSLALDLIIRLIAEVPAASKQSMDRIKMLDKLLNTARAMMETKLKNEDAAQLGARLDQLETRMEELLMKTSESDCKPLEVWNAGQREP
ncbi:MAG: hypothetical protein HY913_08790 [Desulfomonile tiedjei]|nr:hypothetical protein [Desulfomonile tiedjei]